MKKIIFCVASSLLILVSCNHRVSSPELINALPCIYPDYIGVTIPATIAPMNFVYKGGAAERIDVVVTGGRSGTLHINGRQVDFPRKDWLQLLSANKGDRLSFTVSIKEDDKWKQYRSFSMYVSTYSIDYGLVYRKIAPGYEVYSKMGIYERNLSSFKEKALIENTLVPGMCINCHAFNKTNPNHLSLHVRGSHGATLMQINGTMEMLNTKTDSTLSACVYPYWHPGGKYIAYSVNKTRQSFHSVKNERIEVLDLASDIVVYHPATHHLLLCPLLQKKEAYETFPVFSADGTKLYFCSAKAADLPAQYKEVKYNLCSIDFNAENGTFGSRVDTLVRADSIGKSISFPRPSYDGRYVMFTLSDYGNFSIWHKEADLWLLDLKNHSLRPLVEVNSDNTESFHNWSSNSRWFVFSSRRGDGLYTRLYLASIDKKGHVSKPFLLPQEEPEKYYDSSVYSYNVPDFTSQPVRLNLRNTERGLTSDRRVQVNIKK